MSLITHHIETDEGHHNHVKLFVGDDPEYDCLQKSKCHDELFSCASISCFQVVSY